MKRLPFLISAGLLACYAVCQSPTANDKAITPGRLKAHLELVASDLLEGRDTPSRGLDLATLYVATQLKLWGATPAGDNGTFFQDVPQSRGAHNVVAIVPGSDPKLKDEYVAYGAHIDHVGMKGGGTGDRIFNGADDDGSGTVSILEIAHALLTGPRPKRSALFVWHVGEEKGLWGSDYFTKNPTVNLKNVIAQLNIDMIGRSKAVGDTKDANKVLTGADEIYVVGSTKMSTDLQKLSESVNKGYLNLKFNYKYDDPKDQEQIFYRSDHYNYARMGIPIIFYFDGVHEDYHAVGDEVSKIDFDKMTRVARTVFKTGWALANADKRPVVDKPLK
jgi:Zn-dependent M28 family amino/carboxypeptidase